VPRRPEPKLGRLGPQSGGRHGEQAGGPGRPELLRAPVSCSCSNSSVRPRFCPDVLLTAEAASDGHDPQAVRDGRPSGPSGPCPHLNREGELVPANREWHERNGTYPFAYALGAVIVT